MAEETHICVLLTISEIFKSYYKEGWYTGLLLSVS